MLQGVALKVLTDPGLLIPVLPVVVAWHGVLLERSAERTIPFAVTMTFAAAVFLLQDAAFFPNEFAFLLLLLSFPFAFSGSYRGSIRAGGSLPFIVLVFLICLGLLLTSLFAPDEGITVLYTAFLTLFLVLASWSTGFTVQKRYARLRPIMIALLACRPATGVAIFLPFVPPRIPELLASVSSVLLLYLMSGLIIIDLHHRVRSRIGRQQAPGASLPIDREILVRNRYLSLGILSVATAHELKNMLTRLSLLIDHGHRASTLVEANRTLSALRGEIDDGREALLRLLEQMTDAPVPGSDPDMRPAQPGRCMIPDDIQPFIVRYRTMCRRRGIDFSFSPERISAVCGPHEVEQILSNLLENAMDALSCLPGSAGAEETRSGTDRPVPKSIEVRISRGRYETLCIDILDSGRLLPYEAVERIFRPGLSGKSSSGMGLHIARTLARENGGEVLYLPVEKKNCFRIILPELVLSGSPAVPHTISHA